MDIRQQKGQQIAAKSNIKKEGGLYLVPSQSGRGAYKVNPQTQSCDCPDFDFRHAKCKHLYAVQFTLEQIEKTKTTVIENGKATVTETVKVKRVTYKQEWSAYNAAQTHEKSQFQALLFELCAGVEQPLHKFGRPRIPIADMLFSVAFKTYTTLSGRRFASDLREAHTRGFISELPHYNSISRYLESETLTVYLKQLITASSLPLKGVETDFAVDSSGFATAHFLRWFDAKYGKEMKAHDWVKVHLMCGVKTNIVTSVEISKAHASDYNYYKPLVEQTAQSGFQMAEISADKAYLGASNLRTTLQQGAMPYIPFKVNSKGDSKNTGTVWAKLYHFFHFKQDEFMAHYHKRSNVESTFSMIKAKFGERLRSKTETAQINEALCKVLCHNLCCVIQSFYELGIEASFGSEVASVA